MAPKISPAEWEVLNVVWERAPAPITGPEIYEALAGENRWHPKTVNTFLARLEEKGILKVRREGRANLYSSKISREQCVRQESDSFLHRVFRGASGPLLAHFCEHADLSDEEVASLQRLLQERSKTKVKSKKGSKK